MSLRREDDRRYYDDAIRIDLPFLAFRAGRGFFLHLPFFTFRTASGIFGLGTQMTNEDDAYERARQRVRARLNLYRHVVTYAAVVAALVFIDLVTGGGLSGWVLWPAGIFGALLILETFNVFVVPSVWSPEAEERMIEEELRKDNHPQ